MSRLHPVRLGPLDVALVHHVANCTQCYEAQCVKHEWSEPCAAGRALFTAALNATPERGAREPSNRKRHRRQAAGG